GRDRRNLGRHLVGLDVEQRLVRLHGVADLLVPVGHRSFGHGLAELRHDHVHRSSPFYAARLKTRFTSATMRATVGTTASSSWSAEGKGTCGVVILMIGPLRELKASSCMIEAISAPQPHRRGFSSTVNTRPVRADSASIVFASSGTRQRTSITVTLIPSAASASAAFSALGTIAASAMIVASAPVRSTLAFPRGSTCSPSGTSPLFASRLLCSKNSTGSGSRIAAASRPLASAGLDGATTLMPGIAIAQVSTLCECCAPKREPAPFAVRMTSGSVICPSLI